MNRLLSSRSALRGLAYGIGPAICVGSFVRTRPAIRLDSPLSSSSFSSSTPRLQSRPSSNELSTDKVRQISSGSVAGFAIGLTVALFSRTLVFLSGLLAFSLQLASRYSFNISPVNNLLRKSSVWKKTQDSPWFAASFAVTFTLAAFVHL